MNMLNTINYVYDKYESMFEGEDYGSVPTFLNLVVFFVLISTLVSIVKSVKLARMDGLNEELIK